MSNISGGEPVELETTDDIINTTTYQSVSFWYYRDSANSGSNMEVLFDNNRQTNGINSLFFKNAAGHSEEDKISFMSQNSAVSKLYVNGVQETSFATETYPSQDYDFRLALNTTKYYGRIGLGSQLSTNYMRNIRFNRFITKFH